VLEPLSATLTTPTVSFGGQHVSAAFAGLAPGLVGLYQVNVRVPEDAPTGDAVPLAIMIANTSSNTVTIAIE
jgi:uncharacterized protein (TIGR03437 family)